MWCWKHSGNIREPETWQRSAAGRDHILEVGTVTSCHHPHSALGSSVAFLSTSSQVMLDNLLVIYKPAEMCDGRLWSFWFLILEWNAMCNVQCACTRCLDICAAVFGPRPGPSWLLIPNYTRKHQITNYEAAPGAARVAVPGIRITRLMGEKSPPRAPAHTILLLQPAPDKWMWWCVSAVWSQDQCFN